MRIFNCLKDRKNKEDIRKSCKIAFLRYLKIQIVYCNT